MKNIIFLTKDALRCEALPVYGNEYWKTPNIDELAEKGTVFKRHYTAGGSTAMAFTAMSLGKYCYETDRKLYDGNESGGDGNTLFDKFWNLGYEVHIAWDKSYTNFAKSHFKCEGKNTIVHSLDTIIPNHSPHVTGEFDDLTFKDEETEKAVIIIENLAKELSEVKKPLFCWLHMPHVVSGRNSYDSDIDIFDKVVGIFRKYFEDDSIYVSADHGQMNGHKNKFSYGYNVEEQVMRIPLITPKWNGMDEVTFPTTNIQLSEIFGIEPFKKKEFAICETAYYVQPCRKMAIVHNDYKLVYCKEEKKYYLYDLKWDKDEELNLYYPEFYDTDRHTWYSLNQRFYYPNWKQANEEKKILKEKMDSIWKNGTFKEELTQLLLYKAKLMVSKMMQKKKLKNIVNIGK